MIIIRISEGLGNQMFQYAFARALSLRRGHELLLDTSYFNKYAEVEVNGQKVRREFGLAHFNIKGRLAGEEQIAELKSKQVQDPLWLRALRRITGTKRPYYREHAFREDISRFNPWLLHVRQDAYIEGYFTSEDFFRDHKDAIRQDFSFVNQPDATNRRWIEKMSRPNAVVVSLRRREFVGLGMFDVCTLDGYFYPAVEAMARKIENPEFYVFSDDNDWAAEHFRPMYPCHYMSHNYPDFYEDLRLMSHCPNHIIPNSTFSWWAAWLAERPGSQIIAPETWLNTTEVDYSHVIPARWEKLENGT